MNYRLAKTIFSKCYFSFCARMKKKGYIILSPKNKNVFYYYFKSGDRKRQLRHTSFARSAGPKKCHCANFGSARKKNGKKGRRGWGNFYSPLHPFFFPDKVWMARFVTARDSRSLSETGNVVTWQGASKASIFVVNYRIRWILIIDRVSARFKLSEISVILRSLTLKTMLRGEKAKKKTSSRKPGKTVSPKGKQCSTPSRKNEEQKD